MLPDLTPAFEMKKVALFVLASSCGTFTCAHSAIPNCFVNASEGPGGDGKTWATAYSDLQSALTNSACIETWVAKGVYKPSAIGDRSASFIVRPGTRVYGGFFGNERELPERNVEVNTVVLSGDIDSNDANAGTDVDATSSEIHGSNSYHVVLMDGTLGIPISVSTVLDGFTITGGSADDSDGGGLYCDGTGSGSKCSPTISNVIFSGNYAGRAGGAVLNDASNFGDSSGRFIRVTFSGNSSQKGGGAVANFGDVGGNSSPTFDSSTFINNSVVADGGGGGAIDNEAYRGGQSSPITIGCLFLSNSSYIGGAISDVADRSGTINPLFENVTFANNSGTFNSGAIDNVAILGGTITATINNATFSGNRGAYGIAISNDDAGGSGTVVTIANNSIFWDVYEGGLEVANSYTATSEINTSIIKNGCSVGSTCSNIYTSDPNLSQLGDHGGSTWTLVPQPDSPAIDAGDDSIAVCPDVDQRNFVRPRGSHCDIGAVERQPIEDIIFRDGFQIP